MEKQNEPVPETTKQRNLRYLIGQYVLILEIMDINPEWRKLYEERLEELNVEYSDSFPPTGVSSENGGRSTSES